MNALPDTAERSDAAIAVSTRVDTVFVAHIDVVHGCQLRCVGCPNSLLQPKIVPVEPAFFARMLGNVDVERIHTLRLFNFGEPLLTSACPSSWR